MGSLAKKLRDENDKKQLKAMFGKTPKHRCPECHRYSLWMKNEKFSGCVMCELIRRTREERANEANKESNPESNNSGE